MLIQPIVPLACCVVVLQLLVACTFSKQYAGGPGITGFERQCAPPPAGSSVRVLAPRSAQPASHEPDLIMRLLPRVQGLSLMLGIAPLVVQVETLRPAIGEDMPATELRLL